MDELLAQPATGTDRSRARRRRRLEAGTREPDPGRALSLLRLAAGARAALLPDLRWPRRPPRPSAGCPDQPRAGEPAPERTGAARRPGPCGEGALVPGDAGPACALAVGVRAAGARLPGLRRADGQRGELRRAGQPGLLERTEDPCAGGIPRSGSKAPKEGSSSGSSSSESSSTPETSSTPEPEAAATKSTTTTKTTPAAERIGNRRPAKATTQGSGTAKALTKLPAVKHVFVIMLSDEPYASAFGPASASPYLSSTLEKQGELLARYYAVAHNELANGLALISGQGPTLETAANCPTYSGTGADRDRRRRTGARQRLPLPEGDGLAGRPSSRPSTYMARLASRAYHQAGDVPRGAPAPTPPSGAGRPDLWGHGPGSGTPTRPLRNPFVYLSFDHGGSPLLRESTTAAPSSLPARPRASAVSTPSLSYIVPDRCHDGNPNPCALRRSRRGWRPRNSFLKRRPADHSAQRPTRKAACW